MTPELWLLALLWIAWCALHSLLIARGVQRALQTGLGPRFRFVRVGFNIVAFVTFVPIYAYSLSLRGPVVFDWWGAWIPIGAPLLAASLALFWAGGRVYDLRVFLGLAERARSGMGAAGGLSRRGDLGVIRHPWYTAGLLHPVGAAERCGEPGHLDHAEPLSRHRRVSRREQAPRGVRRGVPRVPARGIDVPAVSLGARAVHGTGDPSVRSGSPVGRSPKGREAGAPSARATGESRSAVTGDHPGEQRRTLRSSQSVVTYAARIPAGRLTNGRTGP